MCRQVQRWKSDPSRINKINKWRNEIKFQQWTHKGKKMWQGSTQELLRPNKYFGLGGNRKRKGRGGVSCPPRKNKTVTPNMYLLGGDGISLWQKIHNIKSNGKLFGPRKVEDVTQENPIGR